MVPRHHLHISGLTHGRNSRWFFEGVAKAQARAFAVLLHGTKMIQDPYSTASVEARPVSASMSEWI
jgi:hypothetical protein